MATVPEAFAIAIQHHQGGRLQAAEKIYRQILAVEPNHADALHLLGVIASQAGQHAAAVEFIERAIALQGQAAFYHNNLGEAYRGMRRHAEAVACYRRALEIRPAYAEAQSNLGNALKDQGHLDEAIACYRQAVALRPDLAEAHNNLGAALKDEGRLDDAVACYRRALQLRPDFAEAHNNLGHALHDQQDRDAAMDCWRRAIEAKPNFAEAHNNLGNALREEGKPSDAVACCRRAVELKPGFAEAHSNLGVALKDLGKFDEAIACWDTALQLKPDYAEAHSNLGNVLRERGRLTEAVDCYRRALEFRPGYAGAHSNLGNALKDQGKLEESLACYRQAMELKPDLAEAHSNLLCALHYCPGMTPSALAEAHADFDRRHAAHLCCSPPHPHVGHSASGLRIGFVSPDLGRHPVGNCLVRVLENLDPQRQAAVCYSDRIVQDDLTCRLQAASAQWRDVAGMSDEQLAQQIRADEIDILFDLAGHTARNRLLVFARRPAPVEITWLGYEGTTGLAAMDYLLTDHHVVPDELRQFHRENVLRMPDGYLCYDPPAIAPPPGLPPALERGYVTFGSFNNLAKINPQIVAIWAEILLRIDTARLVLKYSGLGDAAVRQRYLDLFAAHGIDSQRLDFLPSSSYADYLAAYYDVDVALDPFPFSGSVTTCDALWMGLPVVTCPGETFASRHTVSHLANAGLSGTVARDLENYVELAVGWASDLNRLADLRAGLRGKMAASPLCDGRRFADNLAKILVAVALDTSPKR
jgi:predicted O-linked N-acetylglucosamine transferase (SPINDLY family)